jgi:LysM repeat protein
MITNISRYLQQGRLILAGFSIGMMTLSNIATAADEPTIPAALPEPVSVPPAAPEPAAIPEPAAAPIPEPATAGDTAKASNGPEIRNDAPNRYVVKKGDTLWGIAEKFLKDPWLWPEVWQVNPKIQNPHLIYPGQVIGLHYVDGKPVLILEGTELPKGRPTAPADKSNLPVVKLGPKIRTEQIRKSLSTLPKAAIQAFLHHPYLLGENVLDDAPYVVSSLEEHLASATHGRIYAANLEHTTLSSFVAVRRGQKYEDPETGDTLGYEGINLGDVHLVKVGSPSTLDVLKARQEIRNGDHLVPVEKVDLDTNFYPRAPRQKVAGQIISVYQGVSKIGQYNVVVINRGEEHGLETGHILEVYQSGTVVRDPHYGDKVVLPDERAGVMLVFKPYRKISYALIMKAEREMRVLDKVISP